MKTTISILFIAFFLFAGHRASGQGKASGSQTSISGISCSGGLDLIGKGSEPQSVLDTSTQSVCTALEESGYYNLNNYQFEQSYDSLTLYLEHCYNEQGSEEAFSYVNAAISGWSAGGAGRWPDYLAWLKSVLYLRTDTVWYCDDVDGMMTALQTDGAALASAEKYILENNRCPELASAFQEMYNGDMNSRHQQWLTSIVVNYDTMQPYGTYPPWVDSAINADTLAHPYDSTIPSLYAVDLQILLGPQYAAVQENQATSSQALLTAQLLENPMKDDIDIAFEMGRTALVSMQLSDVLGRNIPIANAKYQLEQPGQHDASIPAPNLPPGTYYLRITTDVGDAITLKVVKE